MALYGIYLHIRAWPKDRAAEILRDTTDRGRLELWKVRLWLAFGWPVAVLAALAVVAVIYLFFDVVIYEATGAHLPDLLHGLCLEAIRLGCEAAGGGPTTCRPT